MTERVRSASTTSAYYRCPKMDNDLSPRKTMLVLVIVVGCFAVLWPKVFYPMLVGSANQHIKPSSIDKTTGCCDVISETDVNTIKIMSELCGTIIKAKEDKPLTGKEIVQRCRQEILETCGIDISVVLQEQVRLGQNVKQILDEVRSLNGSLCLKYNYGVAPWRLGVPHRITVKLAPDVPHIRQERPHHLRSELVHPAFRERGRAIPQPQTAPPSRPPPRIVEGRPGPVPGMRPTIGGAGHVVPPSKQGTSSMSVIMPIYTIGIVIFFTYTLMRIIFKKQPEGVGGSLYPPVEPDPHFRKEVFESESSRLGPRYSRDNISSKLVVNAMSALLDEVDQEIEARRKSNEVASQDLVNGTLSNGDVVKPQETEDQPTVKVLGMEMTASCEGGKKWSRPDSPVLPTSPPPAPAEPVPPPQEIYLEGALPPQSHLLVADSATEPQPITGEDPAVVLAGKMTLSVISLDSENETGEASAKPPDEHHEEPVVIQPENQREEMNQESSVLEVREITPKPDEPVQKQEVNNDLNDIEEPEFEIEEYELHPLIVKRFEAAPASKIQVADLEKQNQDSSQSATITEQQVEHSVQKPLIHLESEEVAQTVEVEELEKEVNDLIQEAIESIEQGKPIVEEVKSLKFETNEVNENSEILENISSVKEITVINEEEPALPVVSQTLEELIEPVTTTESQIELSQDNKTEHLQDESIIKRSEDRISDIENKVIEQSSIGSLEESKTKEENLSQVEEQLRLATEEVVKLASKDVDLSDKEDKMSKTETTVESSPSSGKDEAVIELPLEKIEESTDEKLKIEVEVVKSSVQETEKCDENQRPEESEVLKSDELPARIEEKTQIESQQSDGQLEIAEKTNEPTEISEKIEKSQINLQEAVITDTKPAETAQIMEEKEPVIELTRRDVPEKTEEEPKPVTEEKVVEKTVIDSEKSIEPKVVHDKEEVKAEQPIEVLTDDEELGSDEELVEEIEEIVYEEETEEEEEEGSEEEIRRITDPAAAQHINGERSEDIVEESKYTTVSGTTAAENDISDEELTDNEEVEDDEEEIIEMEEEAEDEDYAADESNDVNHVSGESEPEL